MDDGYLKELYAKAENELSPKAGKKLLPINSFDINVSKEGLYTYTITDMYDSTMTVNVTSKCDDMTNQ